jgi:molecular chaperone GrpE
MKEGKKKKEENRTDPMQKMEGSPPGLSGTDIPAEMEAKKGEGDKTAEELKKKLEEKEKEAKDNYDRFLRMAADYENYKKRAGREKEDWIKFANEDLLKAILPFIDNLERAVNHAEKVTDTGVLIEGVRLTLQQLIQALGKFGVSPFESVGKVFDPSLQEAILTIPTDEHEPNKVLEEFQKGYLLNDRLLRPAMVSVSRTPEKEVRTEES